MTIGQSAVTAPRSYLPQGETLSGHSGQSLSKVWTYARRREALIIAGTLGLLALLVGVVVMLLSLADWQRSFVGGGVAAVGLLTLCFVASIAVGEQR